MTKIDRHQAQQGRDKGPTGETPDAPERGNPEQLNETQTRGHNLASENRIEATVKSTKLVAPASSTIADPRSSPSIE
jgi:hypothetical protein